jgi:hypothetical protein
MENKENVQQYLEAKIKIINKSNKKGNE